MTALPQFNNLFRGSAVAANVTTYLAGNSTANTTEGDRRIRWHTAGVLDLFTVVIAANTIATSATTVRTRLNAANGGQSVSIAAGATGVFQDASGADTIANNDYIAYQVVTPNTSGSITVGAINTRFAATSDSAVRYMSRNATLSSAATNYPSIGGGAVSQTEANIQQRFKTAGTLKNLWLRVSGMYNANATYTVRINGADKTVTLTVPANTAGDFEDTSNSDAVAVDDLVCFGLVPASNPGGNIAMENSAIDFVTTNSQTMVLGGNSVPTFNANITRYLGLGSGPGDNITTEAPNVSAPAMVAGTFSKLTCRLSANTVVAASTLRLRTDTGGGAANGNQSASLTGLTTGLFEDASNSDAVVASDKVDYSLVTGIGGTSLALDTVSMLFAATVAGGSTRPVKMAGRWGGYAGASGGFAG